MASEAARLRVEVHEVDPKAIADLCDSVTPQGVVAVAEFQPANGVEVLRLARLVAVLVEPRDPGNVGTLIRIADAAGADAVLLTKNSVDPWNSKSVRASVGSIFHVPVVIDVDLAQISGLSVLAADGDGARDLFDPAIAQLLNQPSAWLFGNEAHGLPEAALAIATQTIRIPIYGSAESLNIAAAAAICLYESARLARNP